MDTMNNEPTFTIFVPEWFPLELMTYIFHPVLFFTLIILLWFAYILRTIYKEEIKNDNK